MLFKWLNNRPVPYIISSPLHKLIFAQPVKFSPTSQRHHDLTTMSPYMQELAPHTSPIFVSAFRLIPAGVALVAWAAASGRQQPKGWQAWLACALFGLVDGTAFQVIIIITYTFQSLSLLLCLPYAAQEASGPNGNVPAGVIPVFACWLSGCMLVAHVSVAV